MIISTLQENIIKISNTPFYAYIAQEIIDTLLPEKHNKFKSSLNKGFIKADSSNQIGIKHLKSGKHELFEAKIIPEDIRLCAKKLENPEGKILFYFDQVLAHNQVAQQQLWPSKDSIKTEPYTPPIDTHLDMSNIFSTFLLGQEVVGTD